MCAPTIAPAGPNSILINLPKRDELLLRIVCALPKASMIGFAWIIFSSRLLASPEAEMLAKYWMTRLVFSVLPAPDSPVIRIDWFCRVSRRAW